MPNKSNIASGSVETGLRSVVANCSEQGCGYLAMLDVDSSEDLSFREVDTLIGSVDGYYRVIKANVSDIHSAKESWLEYMGDRSANRDARRHFQRSDEHAFNELRRKERVNVAAAIAEKLGADWDSYPATETDIVKLMQFNIKVAMTMAKKSLGHSSEMTLDEVRLSDAYRSAMLSELQARTSLATLHITNPEWAISLFGPENIRELPESMQRIAASDLLRGDKGSVILQHGCYGHDFDYDADDITDGQRTLEYMTYASLSKEARGFFDSAARYSRAMGAAACPLNEFGLCNSTIERLDLPEVIIHDRDRKLKSIRHNEVHKLKQFANSFGPDPLRLDCKTPPPALDQAEVPTKRKRHRGILAVIDRILPVEETAVEMYRCKHIDKVTVRVRGDERLQIDPKDEQSVTFAIQSIIKTDLFADYITKHRAKAHGIEDFFAHAVKTILFSDTYHAEPAIEKFVTAPPYYIDGKRARVYRLAGQKLHGAKGGSIGRTTRILFAFRGEGNERTVDFTGVKRKSDKAVYAS